MADEILNLNQAITDLGSAINAKQQEFADSLAVKDATIIDRDASISTLKAEAAVKDARIAELEAQVGSGINPAEVVTATTQVQALTADKASTPTT